MIVGFVLLLVIAAGRAARWRLVRTHPAAGELIDVGGHRLHVHRCGTGPTVVFDAGAGGMSDDWALVRAGLDGIATTVAYDRAGLGRSEPGPTPRSVRRQVTEVRAALRRSNLQPPYVLVGNSYGGLVARAYAYEHTDEVSGLVLVDAAHEDQFDYYPKEYVASRQRMARTMRWMIGIAGVAVGSGLPAFFARRIPDAVADALPGDVDARRRVTIVMSVRHLQAVRDEFTALDDSLAYIRRIRRPLGDLPVIVITHGLPVTEGVPQHLRSDVEDAWQKMQASLTGISTDAYLVVAERSSHKHPTSSSPTSSSMPSCGCSAAAVAPKLRARHQAETSRQLARGTSRQIGSDLIYRAASSGVVVDVRPVAGGTTARRQCQTAPAARSTARHPTRGVWRSEHVGGHGRAGSTALAVPLLYPLVLDPYVVANATGPTGSAVAYSVVM